MPDILTPNPSGTIDFGDVTIGTPATIDVILTDTGDLGCEIFGIAISDSHFLQSLENPTSIDVNDSVTDTLTFTPTGAGVVSGTVTYQFNAMNSPLVLSVTGNGVAAGSKLLSVDPGGGYTFPTTKNGTSSVESLFTLKNTGTVAFNITALAFTAPFAAGTTQPALPYTLNPGATVDVGVIFSPTTNGFISRTNGLIITSGASGSPKNILLQGIGTAITSAYILDGANPLVITGQKGSLQGRCNKFNSSNLSSEVAASTDRLVNFSNPSYENTLFCVQVDYEDLGVASLTVTATTRKGDTASQTISIGTVNISGDVLRELFDLQVTEEVVHIQFSIASNGGPVSILGWSAWFEPAGEVRKDS